MENKIIIGVDEAGRGPLAGPVYASAVVLPPSFDISYLNDSKKLTEKQRETSRNYILKNALYYSITSVDNNIIDSINILNATLLCMKNAVKQILEKLNQTEYSIEVLIDGNKTIDIPNINTKAIIKGDATIPEIMAASILAKTERDAFMIKMDTLYPNYNFKKHKGYGTKEHYEALNKYGECPIHRKSFRLH